MMASTAINDLLSAQDEVRKHLIADIKQPVIIKISAEYQCLPAA